jgi:hypothetical protein
MKRYVFIKRGEVIPRGAQILKSGVWVSHWSRHLPFAPGITNCIFSGYELRRPLKSKESRKPTNNRAKGKTPKVRSGK